MADTYGIRSYGPGKFYTLVDFYAYMDMLNGGPDAEESYPEGGGTFMLMRTDEGTLDQLNVLSKDYSGQSLTRDEREMIVGSVGIIFYERSDGIVEATWFDSKKNLKEEWDAIEAEFAEMAESEEEESAAGERGAASGGGSGMHLVFLPANSAWVFLFGDQITEMGGQRIFPRRDDAVDAARRLGLHVSKHGEVTSETSASERDYTGPIVRTEFVKRALGTLAHNAQFSPSQLGDYLRFDSEDTKKILDSLLRKGYIERVERGKYFPTTAGWAWIESS